METSTRITHVMGSIYDIKSNLFWAPQLFRSELDFTRACQEGAKDPTSMLAKHPDDFELVIVGQWDEQQALLNHDHKRLGIVRDLIN